MITLRDITLQRGRKILLQAASLTVHPGQKVGIIGANGCGKSTLFALLRKEMAVDAGDFTMPDAWVTAHVAQETPSSPSSALDYVIDGDEELRDLEKQLEDAEQAHNGELIGKLHARIEAIDGYTAQHRAARLLHGLGFGDDRIQNPVSSFSGGWRMRLNLGRALMCRSDLLLLDEPTNHLDLDAVLWLEGWLRQYQGTLLLISHDRDFLDSAVNQIAHIEHQTITSYSGNYAQFERQRAEKMALQQKAAEKQQKQIAHMQSFVDRFRAKASKARQAQSRLKALERMDTIAAVQADSPFQFHFIDPGRCPNPLIRLDKIDTGYQQQVVLGGLKITLSPGDRIGLLGRNGAGKSTLIKTLTGELQAISGDYFQATGLRVGYFAQHQLDHLQGDASALLHMQRLAPTESEQKLRDFLGGFGFSGDDATRQVEGFSGGEKARLALARLVWQKPHLLLMDEPTNHLDLRMRDALTLALQEFEGALVLVSHDRYLLRATTDRFLLVADGTVDEFSGDLDDYRQWLLKGDIETPDTSQEVTKGNSAANRKDQRRQEAELRAKTKPLRDKLKKLEQIIEKQEGVLADLEEQLADTRLYEAEQKAELQKVMGSQRQARKELEEAEEAWMQTSEELEETLNAESV